MELCVSHSKQSDILRVFELVLETNGYVNAIFLGKILYSA